MSRYKLTHSTKGFLKYDSGWEFWFGWLTIKGWHKPFLFRIHTCKPGGCLFMVD